MISGSGSGARKNSNKAVCENALRLEMRAKRCMFLRPEEIISSSQYCLNVWVCESC